MTARATFKQSDLERALKAIRKAGYPSARVVIEPGRTTIVAGPAEGSDRPNSCDELFG